MEKKPFSNETTIIKDGKKRTVAVPDRVFLGELIAASWVTSRNENGGVVTLNAPQLQEHIDKNSRKLKNPFADAASEKAKKYAYGVVKILDKRMKEMRTVPEKRRNNLSR